MARAIRLAIPGPLHRRLLRFRWFAGPLPQNWWSDFEQGFRSYSATATGRPRRTETDF